MMTFAQIGKTPLIRQSRSAWKFQRQLYREHLDEVSFLYEQRQNLLKDPHLLWCDLEGIENRIRAHMDGIFLGGSAALEVCVEMRDDPCPGILYAVARAFCRHKRDDLYRESLENSEPENNVMLNALTDALNADYPDEWQSLIEQMLMSSDRKTLRIALSVIGHRRIPLVESVMDMLKSPEDGVFILAVKALGCLGDQAPCDFLLRLFKYGDLENAKKREICMTLLRLQNKELISPPNDSSDREPWLYLAMGLGGGISHVPYLEAVAQSDKVCDECLIALGFLGQASSVDVLIRHLGESLFPEAASLALHAITGADLYEEVFIPDPIDEFTLLEDEREKLRRGQPLYPPGCEPGITLRRISQQRNVWEAWWQNNRTRFNARTSYRLGDAHSPWGILKMMEAEYSSPHIRRLAHDEFVIRHGLDLGFDISLTVESQRYIIKQYKEWTAAHGFTK